MPEFLTAEGDLRFDDRDDTLFTSGLTMMINNNNNNNNIRFSSGASSSSNSNSNSNTSTTIVSEIEEIWEEDDDQKKKEIPRNKKSSSNYDQDDDDDDDDDQRNYNWMHNDDTTRSNFNIRDRIPATIKELEFEGMSNVSGNSYDSNNLYVAVGKSGSSSSSTSMDALRWTLENLVNSPSNFIYLIHVFPEVRLIPSPLGMLPKEQVTPQQVESYTRQQNAKRMEYLQKFINICSVYKVKVDTMLVESDNTAKAVLDLILILNIRRLVMGTTKSGIRKLRKRNGIGGQILKNASDTCDIKVICEGKQVTAEQLLSFSGSSPRPSSSSTSNESINIDQISEKKNKADNNGHHQQQEDDNEPVGRSLFSPPCGCFPTKF